MFTLMTLLSTLAFAETNLAIAPIIGTWKLDPELTKKSASSEMEPLPEEQVDYYSYGENGVILSATVKRKDSKEDFCHYPMYVDGKVIQEFCRSHGKDPIAQFTIKKTDDYNYEYVSYNSSEKSKWEGSLRISKDQQTLTSIFISANKNKRTVKVFRKQ